MILNIDYRENKCIQILSDLINGIDFNIKNLDIADFEFENYLLLERKTFPDLSSSIKDGRYSEQKMRMLKIKEDNPNIQFAYILEGDIFPLYQVNEFTQNAFNERYMEQNSIIGMIINTVLRDKIQIFFTKNTEETCYLVHNIYKRLIQNPNKYFEKNEERLQLRKKDMNSEKNILISQLSCIPGLNSKKSQEIIEQLSLKSLYHFGILLEQNKNILYNIPGIGKKTADNIYKVIVS